MSYNTPEDSESWLKIDSTRSATSRMSLLSCSERRLDVEGLELVHPPADVGEVALQRRDGVLGLGTNRPRRT